MSLSDSDFETFVRTPFAVRSVEITEENIDEIAAVIGEVQTHYKTKEKFISLNRKIVRDMSRAHIGWYVTVLRDNIRVYSPKIFNEQFVAASPDGTVTLDVSDEELSVPSAFLNS